MSNIAAPLETERSRRTLQVELFIAQLLRWGVILSFIILAVGIFAVLITRQTGYGQIHLSDVNSIVGYRAHPDFPNSLADLWNGLVTFKPYAIIALGLVVLIAIPVLRVAVSIIAFALERDWLYVVITTFVLLVLLLSFVIGEAGGG